MKDTMLNKIRKLLFENLPLVLILLAGILLRILFWLSIRGPIQISDSETYIGGAKNLLLHLCLDEYRPPVYLLQLLICGILFTWNHLEFSAVILQNILGLVTVVYLYKLVMEAFENRLAAYLAAFFAAVSMTVYCWDFMILTENLSILLVTLVAYYLVMYLRHHNDKYLKILLTLLFICIFTKPFFMLLPVLVLMILGARHLALKGTRFRIHLRSAALGLAAIYISLVLYSGINLAQHSFFGISTVGKVNTFGKILQYGMEGLGSNGRIVNDVKEAFSTSAPQYIVEGKFLEPWHFIGTYNWNTNHYAEIGSFSREIMIKHPIEYSIKSLQLTWQLLLQSPFKDFIAESEVLKAGHPNKIMQFVRQATTVFDSLYLLIILCGLEMLVLLLFNRKYLFRQNGFLLLSIFLLILYHYLISAFLSYGDYCRLLAPSYPLMYALMAVYISRVVQLIPWLQRKFSKN